MNKQLPRLYPLEFIAINSNLFVYLGKYQEAECIIDDSFHGNMVLDTVAYNTYIKAMLDSGHGNISNYCMHQTAVVVLFDHANTY